MPDFAEIANVKVDRAGMISLNGRPVTLEELKRELARLKEIGGAVWYAREHPEEDPPAAALAVIAAIIEARLPVRLLEEER